MAHNLDFTTGKAGFAFVGSRNDIWHKQGQQMLPGQSLVEWAKAAGLDWRAVLVPAIASLEGNAWDHIPAGKRFAPVPDRFFNCRSDNGAVLGYASDVYQNVQPMDVLEWFQRYIAVDDRFQLDAAGSLGRGEKIWATATYRDPLAIAGDKHLARVLMTTTFDGSGATINQATMTRVVCQNTLSMALADKASVVRTRHNTRFDAARVGTELATLAQGFAQYKAIGDALALNEMAANETSQFFKAILDIPFDAKKEDISTRKMNQFDSLRQAYAVTTQREGAPANSAWAALQAITRYVDHDRSARGDNADAARFASANFGSGNALKGKAMDLLLPRIRDKVLIAA